MIIKDEIDNLTSKLDGLTSDRNQNIGQRDLLKVQIADSISKVDELSLLKNDTVKAIEMLHAVQRNSREAITAAFEQTVTYALQFVYKKDYRFKLEFSQRGNIGELNFKLKDPLSEEYRDLSECHAGGSIDIVSIALRFVLLQTLRPKPQGVIFMDEPGKMLRGKALIKNLIDLYNEMSKNFDRQLIIIPAVDNTDDFIENAENKIQIGD